MATKNKSKKSSTKKPKPNTSSTKKPSTSITSSKSSTKKPKAAKKSATGVVVPFPSVVPAINAGLATQTSPERASAIGVMHSPQDGDAPKATTFHPVGDHKEEEVDDEVSEVEIKAQVGVSTSTHPLVHDLERAEALRRTAARVDSDPDVALLHRLLHDADIRLTEWDANMRKEIEEIRQTMKEKVKRADTRSDLFNEALDKAIARAKDAELRAERAEQGGGEQGEDTAMLARALAAEARVNALETGFAEWRKERDALQQRVETAEARAKELVEVEPLANAFMFLAAVDFDDEKLSDDEMMVVSAALTILGAG